LAQNLAKARADSLELAREKSHADSLALASQEKARQDSMAMARKSHEDSLALQAKLDDEQSKRSQMEKQLLSTGMLLLDAVYFETGKSVISINSKPYLNIIAKMLTKYPRLQIEVAGHTDNVGQDLYNMRLSQDRADAVKFYLIQAEPELNGRLTSRGYGESRPKADNITAEGRQQNRRTQLEVLNKDALMEYNPTAQSQVE
jgi:outer membrane protein OmpA-like peptidoglycan-associated protein